MRSWGSRDYRSRTERRMRIPHVERFVRTLRNEALDHFIFLSVDHIRHVAMEYVRYYNGARPSQAIHGIPEPYPELKQPPPQNRPPRRAPGPRWRSARLSPRGVGLPSSAPLTGFFAGTTTPCSRPGDVQHQQINPEAGRPPVHQPLSTAIPAGSGLKMSAMV